MNGTPPNTEPVAELTGAVPPVMGQGAAADNQAAAPPIAEPVPVTEPAPLPAKPAGDSATSAVRHCGRRDGRGCASSNRCRRPSRQSRHARRGDAGGGAALSERVPDRPPRHRKQFAVVETPAQWRHPADPLAAQSARLPKIWNRDKNESPFKTITRSQAEKLAGILEPLGKHVIVDWAMRYASPSIASRSKC